MATDNYSEAKCALNRAAETSIDDGTAGYYTAAAKVHATLALVDAVRDLVELQFPQCSVCGHRVDNAAQHFDGRQYLCDPAAEAEPVTINGRFGTVDPNHGDPPRCPHTHLRRVSADEAECVDCGREVTR